MDITDAELLIRVSRGDMAAFEAFYARHAPWLTARLSRRCRDRDLVAEVLQETFLVVWRAAPSRPWRNAPPAWVWTVASRKLIDAYRRRAVRTRASGAVAAAAGPTPSAEEQALMAAGVDDGVMVALNALSPELRAVLQATVLDGLSTREAAVLLGLPEGTVKTRARRARIRLREALS